ncbi:hypothetical protein [Paenibacillus sp. L3-i20]|uniref:hypothetical protein n=1 Tax=Paenibacillus sp. L3-i20 TaxID=2905833 RepID=UPI001EDF1C03|nr:hypothetical protein [Paenibacillus sp. L3-i20]GKU75660.1 hypothetical protein L3i20_v200570 [Paenibacillus sp. L3-i20]
MIKKEVEVPVFTKSQIIDSNQFSPNKKDVLHAVLKDDSSYTVEQAEKLINEFVKRKVM